MAENRFIFGNQEPVEPKLPTRLLLKKVILIIGTVLNFVIMTLYTVFFVGLLVLMSFALNDENSRFVFLVLFILTLLALVSAAGELCGLVGTVRERISLLKWHLAYGVLELVYKVVAIVCVSYFAFSISQSTDWLDYGSWNFDFVSFWQNVIFTLARLVFWYALVLWFMSDLRNIQKHSLYYV